jgi:hypothetical protein
VFGLVFVKKPPIKKLIVSLGVMLSVHPSLRATTRNPPDYFFTNFSIASIKTTDCW